MKDNEKLTIKSDYLNSGYYIDGMGLGSAKDNATYELSCREYCRDRDGECEGCAIQQAFDRLGEYESTGLSPGEVEKLKTAAEAINAGLKE